MLRITAQPSPFLTLEDAYWRDYHQYYYNEKQRPDQLIRKNPPNSQKKKATGQTKATRSPTIAHPESVVTSGKERIGEKRQKIKLHKYIIAFMPNSITANPTKDWKNNEFISGQIDCNIVKLMN